MLLKPGKYYRTGSGIVVRVTDAIHGTISAYDAGGSLVINCAARDHVRGWKIVTKTQWNAAVRKEEKNEQNNK